MMAHTRPLLLIEDSPEDREATVRALRKSGFEAPIVCCVDGDDALAYLHQAGKYSPPVSAPRPTLILLDLNMPGTDGRQLLAEVKSHHALKTIPVVVLTTSTNHRDVSSSYLAGASSYVAKPVDADAFLRTIMALKVWWYEVVILPAADTTGHG